MGCILSLLIIKSHISNYLSSVLALQINRTAPISISGCSSSDMSPDPAKSCIQLEVWTPQSNWPPSSAIALLCSISGLYWDACPLQPRFTFNRRKYSEYSLFPWPAHAYTDTDGACREKQGSPYLLHTLSPPAYDVDFNRFSEN